MKKVDEVGPRLGVRGTCKVLGVSPASYYRSRHPRNPPERRKPPRGLGEEERQRVLSVLHQERFVDLAPAEVYATLLDEGTYLCSERTMYRILEENQEVRERRDQLRHPNYAAPELLATHPNELWSWDITKLRGPQKWNYFYLYVILDIFSRYVVGWMVARRALAALAKRLIEETCWRQGIEADQLTLHSDRGSQMISKTVAHLLADLSVTKSLSRPYVPDDNPYSESQFKTMKYRPEFPDWFGCEEHARIVSGRLLGWYNTEHHHSGLGFLTPHDVHYGLAEEKITKRAAVLRAAYEAHPERFPLGMPSPPKLPEMVWINKPKILEVEAKIDALTASQSDDLDRPKVKVLPISGNDFNSEREVIIGGLQ
jgi:putative transposase